MDKKNIQLFLSTPKYNAKKNNISSSKKADSSFSKELNNTISKTKRKSDVHKSDDKEPKENKKLSENEKKKLSEVIKKKLEGIVDEKTLAEIISSLFYTEKINEELPQAMFMEQQKIIIPVKMPPEKIEALNNLIEQEGLGEQIELLNNTDLSNSAKLKNDELLLEDPNLNKENIEANPDKQFQVTSKVINNESNNKKESEKKVSTASIVPEKEEATGLTFSEKDETAGSTINDLLIKRKTPETKNFHEELSSGKNYTNENNIQTDVSIQPDPNAAIGASKNFDINVVENVSGTEKIVPVNSQFEKIVVDQIIEKTNIKFLKDGNEIKIDLDPPSLGSLKVKIVLKGKNITGMIATENNIVKEIVESNLNQLKNSLIDKGMKVDQFSVFVGDQGMSFLNNNRGQHEEGISKNLKAQNGYFEDGDSYFSLETNIINKKSVYQSSEVDIFV